MCVSAGNDLWSLSCRDEDRAILIELKSRGPSRDTFSALSERLQKPSGQVGAPAALLLLPLLLLTHHHSVFRLHTGFTSSWSCSRSRRRWRRDQRRPWLHHYSPFRTSRKNQTFLFLKLRWSKVPSDCFFWYFSDNLSVRREIRCLHVCSVNRSALILKKCNILVQSSLLKIVLFI